MRMLVSPNGDRRLACLASVSLGGPNISEAPSRFTPAGRASGDYSHRVPWLVGVLFVSETDSPVEWNVEWMAVTCANHLREWREELVRWRETDSQRSSLRRPVPFVGVRF